MLRNILQYCSLWIICVMMCFHYASAQDSVVFRLAETRKGNWIDFQVDNLGNYYLLSKENQLKKVNSRGDSVGAFNEVRRYGKLYSMDVTNPLKTLLYYRNFSTILVLDRFMNIVNTIDLRKQQIFQVRAIAQSYDNNIWLYDEQHNKLKKIAEDGSLLMETVDLRTIFDEVPSPEKIIDQEGYVYLYDPKKGVYVFDIYGAFKSKISYLNLTDVTVIGKTFAGVDKNQLLLYPFGTLQERKWKLPLSSEWHYKKIILARGYLYILSDQDILIFTY
ncbi:MAG: hypothetical protein ACK5BV_06945 [Bacteroidota bacterium]